MKNKYSQIMFSDISKDLSFLPLFFAFNFFYLFSRFFHLFFLSKCLLSFGFLGTKKTVSFRIFPECDGTNFFKIKTKESNNNNLRSVEEEKASSRDDFLISKWIPKRLNDWIEHFSNMTWQNNTGFLKEHKF